jgi:hypothetical protein
MTEVRQKHAFIQGMPVKNFRGLPNLCWFKSDLTQENIAILQHDHPDVTFVVQNEQVEQRHMSASEEQTGSAAASASTGFIAEASSFDSPFLPWYNMPPL